MTVELPAHVLDGYDPVEDRYRVYVLRGAALELLFTAPDPAGVGVGIVRFHEDCKEAGKRLADFGQIGVLDGLNREWIVLPWPRGR